jgi:hypothetical protein
MALSKLCRDSIAERPCVRVLEHRCRAQIVKLPERRHLIAPSSAITLIVFKRCKTLFLKSY